ncbi:hypothetical protein C8R46DRAFT_1362300 [Mycena filopes]|nr:hypothetical protein C8R46DRAFT_1362300 [Mycena filopes]
MGAGAEYAVESDTDGPELTSPSASLFTGAQHFTIAGGTFNTFNGFSPPNAPPVVFYQGNNAEQAHSQRTQNRISNWADDTAEYAPKYKSPFVPRSDVGSNTYSGRGSSASPPRHTRHGTHAAGRDSSSAHASPHPRRSQIIDDLSPDDSISQVSGPSHRSGGAQHRARSPSPSRHRSGISRRPKYTVLYPTPAPAQYAVPMQYAAARPQPEQPAAYVVYLRERQVEAVYPPVATPQADATQTHSSGRGLLHKIFGSQRGAGGKSRHSRSRTASSQR